LIHRQFIVREDDSVSDLLIAMSRLTKSGRPSGFALVVNHGSETVGVVTDGDLRKFLIRNNSMPTSIKQVLNRDFLYLEDQSNTEELLKKAREVVSTINSQSKLPIRFLPVLRNKEIVSLLDLEELSIGIESRPEQIVIVGLGYVGLTLAGFLLGNQVPVVGVDLDKSKLDQLLSGKCYISEPGLEHLIQKAIPSMLTVRRTIGELPENVGGARRVFIVCVPTPVNRNGGADLSFVESAAEEIATVLEPGDLVILRSTVPIGTCNEIGRRLEIKSGLRTGLDFSLIFAPERTVEGNALREIGELPQIVSGFTTSCLVNGLDFFEKLGVLTVQTESLRMAELIKIASNAFRDYTFAFSNYLSQVAREHSLDVNSAIKSANFGYPRNRIPVPSPGVGGPCLTKDPYLLHTKLVKVESPIRIARELNWEMPSLLLSHMKTKIPNFSSLSVSVIGMAFKGVPETNDTRYSPSVEILKLVRENGNPAVAWDAVADIEEMILHSADVSPSVFVIANNHPENLNYLRNAIQASNKDCYFVVDPWRLANARDILELRSFNVIHYLSISHYEEDPRT
jgi:UDP-N-acetyl-D-mannosaminuronic acid dehydrogenase